MNDSLLARVLVAGLFVLVAPVLVRQLHPRDSRALEAWATLVELRDELARVRSAGPEASPADRVAADRLAALAGVYTRLCRERFPDLADRIDREVHPLVEASLEAGPAQGATRTPVRPPGTGSQGEVPAGSLASGDPAGGVPDRGHGAENDTPVRAAAGAPGAGAPGSSHAARELPVPGKRPPVQLAAATASVLGSVAIPVGPPPPLARGGEQAATPATGGSQATSGTTPDPARRSPPAASRADPGARAQAARKRPAAKDRNPATSPGPRAGSNAAREAGGPGAARSRDPEAHPADGTDADRSIGSTGGSTGTGSTGSTGTGTNSGGGSTGRRSTGTSTGSTGTGTTQSHEPARSRGPSPVPAGDGDPPTDHSKPHPGEPGDRAGSRESRPCLAPPELTRSGPQVPVLSLRRIGPDEPGSSRLATPVGVAMNLGPGLPAPWGVARAGVVFEEPEREEGSRLLALYAGRDERLDALGPVGPISRAGQAFATLLGVLAVHVDSLGNTYLTDPVGGVVSPDPARPLTGFSRPGPDSPWTVSLASLTVPGIGPRTGTGVFRVARSPPDPSTGGASIELPWGSRRETLFRYHPDSGCYRRLVGGKELLDAHGDAPMAPTNVVILGARRGRGVRCVVHTGGRKVRGYLVAQRELLVDPRGQPILLGRGQTWFLCPGNDLPLPAEDSDSRVASRPDESRN